MLFRRAHKRPSLVGHGIVGSTDNQVYVLLSQIRHFYSFSTTSNKVRYEPIPTTTAPHTTEITPCSCNVTHGYSRGTSYKLYGATAAPLTATSTYINDTLTFYSNFVTTLISTIRTWETTPSLHTGHAATIFNISLPIQRLHHYSKHLTRYLQPNISKQHKHQPPVKILNRSNSNSGRFELQAQ